MSFYLSGLTPLSAPALSDYVPLVDVSDTTTAPAGPSGSDKKVLVSDLLALTVSAGGTLTKYIAPATVALTFATSVTVDASAGNAFGLTLTASTAVIANPTSPVDGQVIRFRLTQDATGFRTLAWGTAYDFGTGSAPTLSTGAGKVDIIAFEYVASISKWCYLGIGLGY